MPGKSKQPFQSFKILEDNLKSGVIESFYFFVGTENFLKDHNISRLKKRLHIAPRSINDIVWEYRNQQWILTKEWIKVPKGFSYINPIVKQGLTTYMDDRGAPGLRTGFYIESLNKGACYMQLLTFSTVNFQNNGVSKPFIEPIRNFVKECRDKKFPMIFDLRSNGGGNGNFPPQV